MLVGRSTQERPEAIPSSWPLDNESGTELDTIHVGRFNTLEGAQRKTPQRTTGALGIEIWDQQR
jgi:hypothetical protein